ncbi:zinc-ribbon domain-containing protein [Embleya sp. AB8]|uniref:zinc-ribbon domain-containing protein n=1 Tax=Embleya sp. AB8 TaxID=3156304 RepID=UPI003C76306E
MTPKPKITLAEVDLESVGRLHPNSKHAAFWTPRTGKSAHWQCPRCRHTWPEAVKTITARKQGLRCPRCGIVPRRTYSLAARRPDVVVAWHPTLNTPLTPDLVRAGDTISVWWNCTTCARPYQRTIRLRCARSFPRCRACPPPR